jgi:hypothetical protein
MRMSMMRIAATVVLAFTSATVLGAEPNNPFAELDAKIARQVTGEMWSAASQSYIRAIWEDYKAAHLHPPAGKSSDYIGDYSKAMDGQPQLLRVSKSEAGRFFVEIEGHRIPAVLGADNLLFTTGDIVQSGIPALTDKPYGELEMMALSENAGKFYFGPAGGPRQTSTQLFRVRPEQADVPSKMKAWAEKAIGESCDALKKDIVPLLTDFTNRELPAYPLSAVSQNLIAQINNEEMLAFLKSRGVQLTAKEIVTADNLVAYLKYKKLGTEASYAWFDLIGGNSNFAHAVSDWQTIRNERDYEFAPTWYLLYNARLKDKRDCEVWADLLRAAFNSVSEQDADKRMLLAACAFFHLPQFKEIQAFPRDRFTFLAEEIAKQKDLSKPYSQILLLTLLTVDFMSKDFAEAAKWSKDLKPASAGLFLSFAMRTFANDIDGAAAALSSLEQAKTEDRDKLESCWSIVRQLKVKKQNEQEAKPRQMP